MNEDSPTTNVTRRGQFILFLSGLILLCCVTSVLALLFLPQAELPSDYRATLCLDLARSPLSFSFWWITPNLTSLPYQPLIVSNRIEYCFFTAWIPWLPRRGGFDLR